MLSAPLLKSKHRTKHEPNRRSAAKARLQEAKIGVGEDDVTDNEGEEEGQVVCPAYRSKKCPIVPHAEHPRVPHGEMIMDVVLGRVTAQP